MGGAIGETRKQLKAQRQQAVLLYDGLCCLCNRTVHFLLRIDHRSVLHFATLQSTSAKSLLEQVDHSRPLPDGVVLIHNGKIYTESDAALKSLQLIGGIWKLLETAVRGWTVQRNQSYTIYVGGVYNAQDKKIGNGVVVPHGYYKIVINNPYTKNKCTSSGEV
jgi:predicted DCC family thiol-disulfide oxidoreductase YuxK